MKSFLICQLVSGFDNKIADAEEIPIIKSGPPRVRSPPILLLKKYRNRIKKDAKKFVVTN